ncbi:MAG: hypothetical protein IT374_25125 [Polyangiaceae bacterium]|nr:hypothetical protein [Polyangiaceae bacterium]
MASSRMLVTVSLAVGAALGAGVVAALDATVFEPPPRVTRDAPAQGPAPEPQGDDAWETANASLVASLAECNRRLRAAGAREIAAPAPAEPAPSASREPRWERAYRERARLTKQDWERYAEAGVVPYRVPCLRDTPFTPSARDIERLGLAPDDATAIHEAYAESNQRVTEQVTPLCAQLVGGEAAARSIGPAACIKALEDAARRRDPAKHKESLTRVAEANAGKRPPPGDDAPAAERLMYGLTVESAAFEADLARRLGPEDAARIASARGLCEERGVASATDGPVRRGGERRRGDR